MSTTLKLLSGILLCTMLVAGFASLYSKLTRSRKVSEFKKDTKEIAKIIKNLRDCGVKTKYSHCLKIPSGCQIRFENCSVNGSTRNENLCYETGIEVSDITFGQGKHDLFFLRKEKGVEVFVR